MNWNLSTPERFHVLCTHNLILDMTFLLFTFLFCLLAIFPAHAGDEGGALLDLIKTRDQTIMEIVGSETKGETDAERMRLKELIGELFDYGRFSQLSLGRYWKERTQNEQNEFTDLCRRLTEKNYADPKLYTKSEKIDYIGVEMNSTEAVVQTEVHYKGEMSSLDYKMHKVEAGWLIYDMVVDDLSITRSNRAQFRKEIRKSSYEGLVQKLKDKLIEETD